MAITSATRDPSVSSPNVVRISSTNTISEVLATGYVATQTDNLKALNSGSWEWVVGDIVAMAASDGSTILRFSGDDFSTFISLPGGGSTVDSIQGTANQVLVNGTSGSPQIGTLILTTPQNIAPGSSPTFNALTLTAPLTGANGGTGYNNGTKTISLDSPSNGYVLTSDGTGNCTLQEPGYLSGAVLLSPSGNQIITTNNLSLQSGSFTASGAIQSTGSNVSSGSNGSAGSLISYPSAGGAGTLALTAANSAGNYSNVLTNASTSAARTWTLPNASGTVALSSSTLPSIQGTANQVLVNGTSATPVTGTAVTLTTPQDIGTSSFVEFGKVTVGQISITSPNVIITDSGSNANLLFRPDGSGSTVFGLGAPFTTGQGMFVQSFDANGTKLNIGSWNRTLTSPSFLGLAKSRGLTPGTFDSVISGDILGQINFSGDDGTSFVLASSIRSTVTGAVSTNIIPSSISMFTTNTSGTRTLGLTLDSDQILTLAHPLPVGSGGTGLGTTPTNGQLLIGNGTNYSLATITAGTGISITNGSGSITIASSGGGLTWTTLAGTSQAAAVNNGYISGAAGATTITLPATAAIGSIVAVEGLGAGGWILAANSGQTIQYGTVATTTAGSLASIAATDNVYVHCIVNNTTWRVQTTNSIGLVVT